MTERDRLYDLDSMAHKRVDYPSGGLRLAAYLYIPEGEGPFPAVVVNHGSDGLSRRFQQVAGALNEMGYAAFLPIRRGYSGNPGPHWRTQCTAPERSGEWARQFVDALVHENDDVLAALSWLSERPDIDADRIGVMGISFGGIMTLLAAARPSTFRAGVSFAAGGMAWPLQGSAKLRSTLVEAMSRVTIPLFLIQAQNDYSLSAIYALGGELARLGKVHEARVYPATGTTPLDGHALMLNGVDTWREDVERFLARSLAATPRVGTPSETAQASANLTACSLNVRFAPESRLYGKPFRELLVGRPANESQAKYIGAWQGTIDGELVRLVVFPTNRLQYVHSSMRPGDDASAYATYVIDGKGSLVWESPSGVCHSVSTTDGSVIHHVSSPSGELRGTLARCGV